jgi:hypothetical protein
MVFTSGMRSFPVIWHRESDGSQAAFGQEASAEVQVPALRTIWNIVRSERWYPHGRLRGLEINTSLASIQLLGRIHNNSYLKRVKSAEGCHDCDFGGF